MRKYGIRPDASTSFAQSELFRDALEQHIRPVGIDVVIESGTYLGDGSTLTLAEFFKSSPPKSFKTIEVSWTFFETAVQNLRGYDFISCLWGRTVGLQEALSFVRADPAIRDHHLYPDVWIDDDRNPVEFYTQELHGKLFSELSGPLLRRSKLRLRQKLVAFAKRHNVGNFDFLWAGEDLLSRLCSLHRSHRPLVVLDSAGGIGYLEFQTINRVLADKEYFLILDDIDHLKHFRSARDVKASPDFEVLAISEREGWLMAHHRP